MTEVTTGEAVVSNTLLGRIGHPGDIADVAIFLASEQARWLTGQLLYMVFLFHVSKIL